MLCKGNFRSVFIYYTFIVKTSLKVVPNVYIIHIIKLFIITRLLERIRQSPIFFYILMFSLHYFDCR